MYCARVLSRLFPSIRPACLSTTITVNGCKGVTGKLGGASKPYQRNGNVCFYFVWLKTNVEITATGNTLSAIIASQQCSAAAEREVKPFSALVQNKD